MLAFSKAISNAQRSSWIFTSWPAGLQKTWSSLGKSAQDKFQFRSGDMVSGESEPLADERKEPVRFYKTVKLKVLERGQETSTSPPFLTIAPLLEIYRERGHLSPDLLHRNEALLVPVENEQVMHLYELHHVMAHLPIESFTRRYARRASF